jgi:4-hydroxybenzoate polyprenyltransferase
MRTFRSLWKLGRPRILGLMCGLALAGATLSPEFLSAAFPPPRLAAAVPIDLPPHLWSLCYALGAMLVTGLLWFGTALVNAAAGDGEAPELLLRWGLGAQAAAFGLIFAAGNRQALLLSLFGAGVGNAYALPRLRVRQSGVVGNLTTGGGVMLAMCGGMMAQTGVTQVGFFLALALGILAAAAAGVEDFCNVEGDRAEGLWTLPVLLGVRGAVYVNMAAVTGAYLLALALLVQTIGIQGAVIALFSLPLAANLYVLSGLIREPGHAYARKAYRLTVMIFVGVTALYVGAQAIY